MRALCDIETDGLDDATRIWCVSIIDIDTDQEFFYGPDELHLFEEKAKEITYWIGHNFLSFDWEKIERFTSVRVPFENILDTLILSRLLYTGEVAKHSLEAWGTRLGYAKVEHEDWSQYSEEMKQRCVIDTRLNLKLYRLFLERLPHFSAKCVDLEHQTQHILNQQRKNGFHLDVDKAYGILHEVSAKAAAIQREIHEHFPPRRVLKEVYSPRINKDGSVSKQSTNKLEGRDTTVLPDGTVEIYETEVFNLGSNKQIMQRMAEAGWKPIIKTKAGTPKLCEENLATLPPAAPAAIHKLIEWWMLTNRVSVIEGWLNAYNPITKCIHGTTIGLGAITHRMAHYDPQMANIPAIRNDYGVALRSCLGIGPDLNYNQLGTDISGIQLCILAHYLDDAAYTEAIANGKSSKGTDVHSVNMRILQEIAPHCTRDNAKTFIYAMLLGAGGFKLGSILGMDAKAGHSMKERLFKRIPAFKRVQKMCEMAAARGYMVGIDGRRVPVKSEHYALSVYLQCGEAIIMKQALVYMHERAKHLDWKQMAVVHDEIQSRVHKDHANELAAIQIQSIVDAGKLFRLRCPLAGEYKLGRNWAECH